MTSNSEVFNIRQAAAFIGAHEQTVRRLARRGAIPAFKVGRDWRFRKEALERWIEEQRSSSEPVSPQIVSDRTDESLGSPRPAGRGPSMADDEDRQTGGEPARGTLAGHRLDGRDTLLVTGRSILPAQASPTGVTAAIILEVALDSATHRVVMVASDGLLKLGREMLTSLLVGRSLTGAIQVAIEGFSNGYHSELRQPVIAALEDLLGNYRGICTPVIGVDEDKPFSALVIDDDEKVCNAMRRQLERLECRVRVATSGKDGLQILRQETPDLILLDLVLPEMNGIQFLELLREAHPDLPVVIVTGYPDSELMKQATQYAPLMLLAKPVDAKLLERTVRTALAEKMSAMRSAGHVGRSRPQHGFAQHFLSPKGSGVCSDDC